VASGLRKELELFLYFIEVLGVTENSIRDLSEVTESMIASHGFSDNKLRIVYQVFDVIRKEYISGTLPDDRQLLLCAIISELEYNVGSHSRRIFKADLSDRSRRVIDLVRLRDRVLASFWQTSDVLVYSYFQRTLWTQNVLSIDDAELDLLESTLRAVIQTAASLAVTEGVDLQDSFPPLLVLFFIAMQNSIRSTKWCASDDWSNSPIESRTKLCWIWRWNGAEYIQKRPWLFQQPNLVTEFPLRFIPWFGLCLNEACMNGRVVLCDESRSLSRLLGVLETPFGSFQKNPDLRAQYYEILSSLRHKVTFTSFNARFLDAFIKDFEQKYPPDIEEQSLNRKRARLVGELNSLPNLYDAVGMRLKRLLRELIGWDSQGKDGELKRKVAEAVILRIALLDDAERLWVDRILSRWMRSLGASAPDNFCMMIELYKWTGIVADVDRTRAIKLVASISDIAVRGAETIQ
jgi:hypothetical protein